MATLVEWFDAFVWWFDKVLSGAVKRKQWYAKDSPWYAKDSPEGEWSEDHPIPTIYRDIYHGNDKRPTLERIEFSEAYWIVEKLNE